MAYYSYVSVLKGEKNRKKLEQENALNKYAEENDVEYSREFEDKIDASLEQPEFDKLDKTLKAGDTVVIKDLLRFKIDAKDAFDKYMDWRERQINVVFTNSPTVSTSYIEEFEEKEKELVERVGIKDSIEILIIVEADRLNKQTALRSQAIGKGLDNGKPHGREKGSLDKLTPELEADIRGYLRDRQVSLKDILDKHKISRNTLKKYIKYVEDNRQE